MCLGVAEKPGRGRVAEVGALAGVDVVELRGEDGPLGGAMRHWCESPRRRSAAGGVCCGENPEWP